jgi:hypothetical protein
MPVNGSGSPVIYPTVTVGTEVLTVKIGLLAELIISRAGLSFGELINSLRPNKDPRNTARLFDLFSACVAHNYKEQGLAIPTAEEWAIKFDAVTGGPENSHPLLIEIYKALTEAVVKRWPSLKPVQETAAKP